MKNTKQTNAIMRTVTMLVVLLGLNAVNAATFKFGYTVGSGLLGPTFFDTAAAGGGDSASASDLGFVVQMTNRWQAGQTIKITGVALPIRTATTSAGTWTFTFYDLNQGADANAYEGSDVETVVGTANVDMAADVTSIGAYYATFDTPIIFTAQSSGIAVRFTTTSLMRLKINTSGALRLNTTTGAPIGGANAFLRFTLAGSVVLPPPAGSLVWRGNANGDWDGATANWLFSLGNYNGTTTNYYDDGTSGPPTIFDDTLNASFLRTNINLTTGIPLRPGSLTLANDIYNYNLTGPGKITGGTTLTNNGARTVTLNTANDFTGGSVLNNGRIRLGNVAGLGTGPITFGGGGLSSVGATPLAITAPVFLSGGAVLGDPTDNGALTFSGTLDFIGGTRPLNVQSAVLLSGVLTNGGISSKTGPGTLTITGPVAGTNGTWNVANGALIASGTAVQATIQGFNVGASADNGVATLAITNGASVSIDQSFALDYAFGPRVGAQGQSSLTSSNYLLLAGSFGYATNASGTIGFGNFSAYGQLDMYPGSRLRVGGLPYQGTSAGSTTVFNLNGATIAASSSNTNFMSGHTAVNILAGGVTFDTESNDITIGQALLAGSGGGGLTKTGAGALWLRGVNTYSGSTIVQAGTLGLYPGTSPNNVLTASAVVVSNGATLAVDFVPAGPGTAEITRLSLHGSTLSINYGDLFGSPTGMLGFSGPGLTGVPVTISGVQTIKLSGQSFGLGQYPIIQFSTLTGSGSFVASLPPGVVGTVGTNGSQIVVNITAAPKNLTWYGSTDSATLNQNWNTTSLNWVSGSQKYSELNGVGDYVRFDDTAFFNGVSYATNINLTQPLAPLMVTVDSGFLNYRFSTTGSGKLTGPLTSLVKLNSGNLELLTSNDYAGGSTLAGSGAVLIGNNSALGSGTVALNGAAVSSDGIAARTIANPLTIGAASTLGDAVNSGTLNLTGPVDFGGLGRDLTVNSAVVFSGSMTNGGLDEKRGPGILTFSGVTGNSSQGQWQVEDGAFVISGGSLAKSAGGIRVGSTVLSGVARLVITNGAAVTVTGAGINLRLGNDQAPAADPTSTNILDVAGTLAWATDSSGTVFIGTAGQLSQLNLLAGGWLQINNFSAGANPSELNLNGGTLSPTTSRADFLQGLTSATVQPGGVTFDTAGFHIGVAQPLLNGGGGLTKAGAGTLALNGVNTYAGLTTVTGGSLGGTGVISGPVTVGALGTLSPGMTIGTLTINNNLTLGGNVLVELNKSLAPANDSVAVTGALAYGGTLTVNNLGPALAVGDSFPIFPAGGTGSINVVGDAGSGRAFSFNPATGVLSVVASTTSPIPLNYTIVSPGVVQFSWDGPFKLQWQQNAASVGLSNNWADYPDTSNPVNVTNNPAVPTTFFQLKNL